jgi:hypothetical protein
MFLRVGPTVTIFVPSVLRVLAFGEAAHISPRDLAATFGLLSGLGAGY